MFTLENTKDATHYAVYAGDCIGQMHIDKGTEGYEYSSDNTNYQWDHCETQLSSHKSIDLIELSRPAGERKEDYMMTVSYAKSLIKFTAGDVVFGAIEGDNKEYTLDEFGANALNTTNEYDNYFVISFADSANTGKQPASGYVRIDCSMTHGGDFFDVNPSGFAWELRHTNHITKWKPNHAAMLKQYQLEQANKHHQIEIQIEALGKPGELVEFVEAETECLLDSGVNEQRLKESIEQLNKPLHKLNSAAKTLNQMNYSYSGCGYWKPPIGKSSIVIETPVFTQAMKDAGELPPVGSAVLFKYPIGLGLSNSCDDWLNGDELEVICHSNCCDGNPIAVVRHKNGISISLWGACYYPIDARTGEEKLRDAVAFTTGLRPRDGLDEVVNNLLSSDKFTITLN